MVGLTGRARCSRVTKWHVKKTKEHDGWLRTQILKHRTQGAKIRTQDAGYQGLGHKAQGLEQGRCVLKVKSRSRHQMDRREMAKWWWFGLCRPPYLVYMTWSTTSRAYLIWARSPCSNAYPLHPLYEWWELHGSFLFFQNSWHLGSVFAQLKILIGIEKIFFLIHAATHRHSKSQQEIFGFSNIPTRNFSSFFWGM